MGNKCLKNDKELKFFINEYEQSMNGILHRPTALLDAPPMKIDFPSPRAPPLVIFIMYVLYYNGT